MLLFHVFACIWIKLGHIDDNGTPGWVITERLSYEESLPKDLWYTSIYCSAVYFIVTTSTTVGYGDYYGVTRYEQLFLIVMQFAGICIFALMSG